MTTFNNSVYKEIAQHIVDNINDHIDSDTGDLHNALFNESYYIVGYYQASQWLKEHDIDAFECIEYVQEYEKSNFGETHTKINSESMVNMLAYILGDEVLYSAMNDADVDTNDTLTEDQAQGIIDVLTSEYSL